jgi:hypothetical protein
MAVHRPDCSQDWEFGNPAVFIVEALFDSPAERMYTLRRLLACLSGQRRPMGV